MTYSQRTIYDDPILEHIERLGNDLITQETERRNMQLLLRAVMDNLPSALFVKDSDYRYTLANNLCRRLAVPMTPEEDWMGKTDLEAFGQAVHDAVHDNDVFVMETGERLDTVQYIPQSDGSTVVWAITKFRFMDSSGRLFLGGIGTPTGAGFIGHHAPNGETKGAG